MSQIKNQNLTQSFDVEGVWYLPDDEKNKIHGTLKYSPKSILLKLHGSFSKRQTIGRDGFSIPITILGLSNEGEQFSLMQCSLANLRSWYSKESFDLSTFYVHSFYAGDFFVEDETVPDIKDAEFSFTNLNAWLRYNSPIEELSFEKETFSMTVNYGSEHVGGRNIFL